MSPKSKSVDLSELPARVDRITFNGITKTKDDLLATLAQPLCESTRSFQDLFLQAHILRQHLLGLNGSFKSVYVVIDSKPGKNSPNGYDVRVDVRESRPIIGSVNTTFSPHRVNKGSILSSVRAVNVLGRGESVLFEYSTGPKGSLNGFNLSSTKPLVKPSWDNFPLLSACIYQSHSDFLPSLFRSEERGVACELVSWPFPSVRSSLRLEGNWRSIFSMDESTPFPIREMSGHFLKTAIRHQLDYDTREYVLNGLEQFFPSRGWLVSSHSELAGLAGNQTFAKQEISLQSNGHIPRTGILLQACTRAGILASPQKELAISEKFFVGGPLTLRGFGENGVGPSTSSEKLTSEGGKSDVKFALGSNAYWLTGLHVYSPLPFLGTKAQIGQIIYKCLRLHGFVNAGSAASTIQGLTNSKIRTSIGAGLVLQAGPAIRFELNFVKPLSFDNSLDTVKHGIDFGFGISFS